MEVGKIDRVDRSLRPLTVVQRRTFLLIALISLLAFVANALFLQTHLHLDHRPIGTAHHAAPDSPQPVVILSADEPCALCEALSFAGPYLQPAEATFAAQRSAPFSAFSQIIHSLLIGARSHNWQSRAPPGST